MDESNLRNHSDVCPMTTGNAIFCNHANENPNSLCTCPDSCPCWEYMCMKKFGAVPHYAECPVIHAYPIKLTEIQCWLCRKATLEQWQRVNLENRKSEQKFLGGSMMNTVQLKALNKVLEYLLEDECEDYWMAKRPDYNHIYLSLLRLKEYYDEQTKNEEGKEEQWYNQGDGHWSDCGCVTRKPPGFKEAREGGGGESKSGAEED